MIYLFKQALYIPELSFHDHRALCRSSAVYKLISWVLLFCQIFQLGKKIVLPGEQVPCPAPRRGQPFSSSSFTLDSEWLSICLHFAKTSFLLLSMLHPSGNRKKPLLPIAICMRSDEHRSHVVEPTWYGNARSTMLRFIENLPVWKWKIWKSFRTKWTQWTAKGPVWMPLALKRLCLIQFWGWMNSPFLLLALWGHKNWPPNTKVKNLKIF